LTQRFAAPPVDVSMCGQMSSMTGFFWKTLHRNDPVSSLAMDWRPLAVLSQEGQYPRAAGWASASAAHF
jgi:hypothetical protein